jgi:hypothetical protein
MPKNESYGTHEELKDVAVIMRKAMFDFIMGKITKYAFLQIYYGYECFLLEHGYVETEDPYFEMDLPDGERFVHDALYNHNVVWKEIKK